MPRRAKDAALRSRTRAIPVRVSAEEYAAITAKADAAGLSISAYLRLCALADAPSADPQTLAQVDLLITGMEAALDTATAALDATLRRLDLAETSHAGPA
ncbi:hypothetical protein UAJ10_28885 [Nitrospirillum sp. BR 11164]|uniref:plasmid mobilization protein n=1 Tax=Nitrospirillum sp. BR 11164 TaxID=3104324 RepID=UPI002AFF275C|nr:hypothetical protein [Nitrospirillum sp. BR 11164]MEA1653018.1 hypothetical protein [Nitrospirillum sp. BR 11164]